jgi:hypothetical protein
MYRDSALPATEKPSRRTGTVKLTLTLDAAAAGLRAALAEEWEEIGASVRMEPMVRHFDTEEQALAWGRRMAGRRRLSQIYLIDRRKPVAR